MPDQQFSDAAVLQVDDSGLRELVVTRAEEVPGSSRFIAAAPALPSWDQTSGLVPWRAQFAHLDQPSPSP